MQRIVTHPPRNGLSIIEVLTAMVVAMIGVFGVMILIPFAVKQAKVGMDSDAAVQLARNAYSQFEISGYRSPENWWIPELGRSYNPDPNSPEPDPPRVLAIDPLSVIDNGPGIFPLNPLSGQENSLPVNLRIPVVNLAIPVWEWIEPPNDPPYWEFSKGPMTLGVAQRFFRADNDLTFGAGLDDLDPPLQIFDRDNNGYGLRRQSKGRISWSAIVVPYMDPLTVAPGDQDNGAWSYKLYILVYKVRKTLAADEDGQMAITELPSTLNEGYQSPLSNVFIPSGVPVPEGSLKRDDWVMLINQKYDEDPVNNPSPEAFRTQIAFCRIIDYVSDPSKVKPTVVSLDGSDFNFYGSSQGTSTYIIHLKDVIGVYEHSVSPENESTWTMNF